MKREDEKDKKKSVEEEEEKKWKNRSFTWMELGVLYSPVSYTHLTLPTICSV